MAYEDAIMREAKRRSSQPNRVVSPPNQNFTQKAVNWGRDTGSSMIPGIWGVGMKGIEALTEGVAMANENARWFKENAPDEKRYAGIPIKVRESVMTQGDTDFYNKYMNLAEMEQDRTRKQYYLDQADTARRNLQITKRINYGLGEMDLDETPFEGYESYDPGFAGFEGETGPRFDIDRFSEAMSEYLPQEPEDWGDMSDPFFMEREWELPPDTFEEVTLTDLMGPEPIDMPDEIEDTEETTETFTDLGDTHEFTESWKTAFDATDYIDVQEYVKTMSNTEGSLWYGKDEDWIVKDMIKRNYIKEK